MNNDFTTISTEALRRLGVESAFAHGAKIECRVIGAENWVPRLRTVWDWHTCDYRVAEPVGPPKRTKAELLKQIHALIDELATVTA